MRSGRFGDRKQLQIGIDFPQRQKLEAGAHNDDHCIFDRDVGLERRDLGNEKRETPHVKTGGIYAKYRKRYRTHHNTIKGGEVNVFC